MRPDPRELVPQRARLRQLVLVVGKYQVEPAAVDLEHRCRGTPRPSPSTRCASPAAPPPRRLPRRVLAGLRRLPQREVARILLARVRLLLLDLIGTLARELPVSTDPARPGSRRRPPTSYANPRETSSEIAPTIAGTDSVAVGSTSGRPRPSSDGVLDVPPRRVGGQRRAGPRRRVVDLVVDVRDVLDERHVVAPLAQPAPQPHRDDERPRVPDVDPLVDGRPAEVHADRAGRRGQAPPTAVTTSVERIPRFPSRPRSQIVNAADGIRAALGCA